MKNQALFALSLFCAAVAAQPSLSFAQSATAPAPSALQLKGAPNFRDIGGYTTADGRKVKFGRLYRSGQLATLTEVDQSQVAGLGIRYVYDFRTEGERTAAPTRLAGSPAPEMVWVPIAFGSMAKTNMSVAEMMKQMMANVKTEADARQMMRHGMAEAVDTGKEGIGQTLSKLSAGNAPGVVHCSAGKDRTGLFTAILLTTLGVSRDQVMADYLKSNAAMAAAARNPSAVAPGMEFKADPAVMRALMGVEPEYLQAAFDAIDQKYGSFDAYRRQALQLSDSQVEELKSAFLE